MIIAIKMVKNGFVVELGSHDESHVFEAVEGVTSMRDNLHAALAEVKLQFLRRIEELEAENE